MSHLALPGMRASRTQSPLCHLAPGDLPGLGVDGEAEQVSLPGQETKGPPVPGVLEAGGGSHTHSIQIKPHHPITQKPSKQHQREFRQRPEGGRGYFSQTPPLRKCLHFLAGVWWMDESLLALHVLPSPWPSSPPRQGRASRPPAEEESTSRNTGQINRVMSPCVSTTDRTDQGDRTWQ